MRDYPQVQLTTRLQLRRWLEKNHETSGSIWLVTYKKHCGRKYLAYDDVVEEVLCFGWIDSLVKTVDEDRSMQLLSPRKKGGTWSAVNKRRLTRLRKAGLMTEAGEAKVRAAKKDGSWTLLDDVEKLLVPEDLRRALDKSPKAAKTYDAYPRGQKKAVLWWIKSAKRDATRKSRIAAVVSAARKGEPALV